MKLEKNSEIFKSISYRYKFLVGARDPCMLTHGQGLTPLTILKKQIKPF